MKTSNANAYHSESHQKLVFRPTLLVLTCFLASVPLYPPNARALGKLAMSSDMVVVMELAFPTVCMVLALGALLRSLKNPAWNGFGSRTTITAAVFYAIAQALGSLILWSGIGGLTLFAVLCTVWAASAIVVAMAWVRLFAMDFRSIMLHGSITCIATSALVWVLSLSPAEHAAIIMTTLAMIGSAYITIMELRSKRQELPHSPYADSSQNPATRLLNFASVVWLSLTGFLISLFLMSCYALSINDMHVDSECIGGILASVAVLILCFVIRKIPLVVTMERLVVPICIALCIMLGSFPLGTPPFFVGAASAYTPLMLVTILALSTGVAVVTAGEFPMPFIFGAVLFSACAAELVGRVCALTIFTDSTNPGEWSWVVLCFYFAIVLIELSYFTWKRMVAPRDDAFGGDEIVLDSQAVERLRIERIDKLADEHNLTTRERELFGYMSRGYGSPYIAKKLFISVSTVRTHAKHIYRKLGVNSREGLLALMEDGRKQVDNRD